MSFKVDASSSAAGAHGADAKALREAASELRAGFRDGNTASSSSVSNIGGEGGLTGAGEANGAHEVGPSFGAILEQTAMAASAKEREAVSKAEALAQGRTDDLHGTMITMKEADISMKLVGSVRDKLMDAFHELWRINV